MPNSESLSSRTYWNALGSLIATFGRMVSSILIARQLGPEQAGQYAFIAWLVEFTIVLASFGLLNSLTRFLAELNGKGDSVITHKLVRWITRRYLLLVLCGAFGLTIYLSYTLLVDSKRGLALILFMLVLFQAQFALVSAHLAGKQAFRTLAKMNLVSSISLVIFQPALTLWLGLTGAVMGAVLSYAMSAVWLRPLLAAAVTSEADGVPSSLPKYAFYTWLAAIVSALVWTRAELFFLNQYSTSVQAGYFSVGLTLASVVTFGAGLLTGALLPHFSMVIGSNNRTRLQRDYALLTTIVALLVFPISLGGVAVMSHLLPLVFGGMYVDAVSPAMVLMVTGMLAFAGAGSSLTYASGESAFVFRTGAIGALIMVVSCYLVAPKYGALGAAFVRLGVQILMIGAGTLFIHRHLRIYLPYRALFRIAIASALSALAAHAFMLCAPFYPLACAVIAGSVSYFILLRILRPMSLQDVAAMQSVVRYLPMFSQPYANSALCWLLGKP